MPALETDQEQIEMLKKWWAEYGKYLLIAILIGVGGGFAWRYWHQQQLERREQASEMYEDLLFADSKKNMQSVIKIGAEIQKRFENTPYASMANLMVAKEALNQKNYALALDKLHWAMDHSKEAGIQQIARLRAARVLLTQKKFPEALALLQVVQDATFQPLVDEIKGDVYFAMGDGEKAQKAYQAERVSISAVFESDVLLSMKLAQSFPKEK